MHLAFSDHDPIAHETPMLALAAFDGQLADVRLFQRVDQQLGGRLGRIALEEGFTGRAGETLCVHVESIGPRRVLLVGLGPRGTFDVTHTRRYGAAIVQQARRRRCDSVTAALPPLDASASNRAAQLIAEGALFGSYRFAGSLAAERRAEGPESLLITAVDRPLDEVSLARGRLIADGVCLARDVANATPTARSPRRLGEVAVRLGKDNGLTCSVLAARDAERQGLGLFVAAAGVEGRLLHLTYRPRGREGVRRRVALVGQAGGGGGQASAAGAAAVLGALSALPALALQAEVHAIVPALGEAALPAGETLAGLAGFSVEVRGASHDRAQLALADALAYAAGLTCDEIIDVAALCDACSAALGMHTGAVLGPDAAFVARLLGAARRAGEPFWQLPLASAASSSCAEVAASVDASWRADLATATDGAGAPAAVAALLQRCVGTAAWVHLDIGGPAFATCSATGHNATSRSATGFGVSTLIEYLVSRDPQS